ncbi:GNAT family N-acetyltransferase [Streptomyces durbertensis]|uniref:GNAT family N-acetyltransferase n=1 Tax=Streptomyces durbertensis TaxID=2448886 RepID=A0ABR6EP37_9ACTN|nr:GNAT family N-acetyltransferase [Streptomyces durbertensis]
MPLTALVTDRDRATEALDTIVPVYERVFAEPPYHEGPDDVSGFVDGYRQEAQQDGFRLALAHDDSGQPAGFAYGYPLQPTTRWWHGFLNADLADAFTREDGHRTFVIKELAVLPEHRRTGTARSLHTGLLHGLTAERATLAVVPEAEPAVRLYAALGYTSVGLCRPWADAPLFDVMVLPLR